MRSCKTKIRVGEIAQNKQTWFIGKVESLRGGLIRLQGEVKSYDFREMRALPFAPLLLTENGWVNLTDTTRPPIGQEWHNTAKVTKRQIGEGYRLCLRNEPQYVQDSQWWDADCQRWSETVGLRKKTDFYSGTLRVKADKPFMI